MEKKTKEAFQSLLEAIVNDEEVRAKYNLHGEYYSGSTEHNKKTGETDLTVIILSYLSNNHVIDNHPEEWGVSLIQARKVRAYFQNSNTEESLFGLYSNFHNYFKGEYRGTLRLYPKVLQKIETGMPYFVKKIIESEIPVISSIARFIWGPYIPIIEDA